MKQLDFLSYVKKNSAPSQLSFLSDENEVVKPTRKTGVQDVEEFFASITPEEIQTEQKVWEDLQADDLDKVFKRWLFAFMSIHTTWESNVKGYLAVKDWTEWFNRPEALKERIVDSRVGLHNNRTKFISAFATKFWSDPSFFKLKKGEKWVDLRDRLTASLLGIGRAKTSFALEMTDTFDAEVFCGDVHLLRFYGYKQEKVSNSLYRECERHWVEWSKMYNLAPAVSRAIYWNRNQGQENSMYWFHVFQEKDLTNA